MSIIVWIFNWICWINQCCCCDFLHNPVNKRIAWWTSFIFLLGILACCISAFVSINRFGFAIEGTWCAIYRIYDDIIYGQLTDSKKKWHGIKHIQDKLKRENGEDFDIGENTFQQLLKFLNDLDGNLTKLKVCYYFSKVYFCLLLISVTFAAVSMMFYVCLKRQGYLIIFMHVLWNIIRFFIFSFFLFGTAFGILFLIMRDSKAVVSSIFSNVDPNYPNYLNNKKDVLGDAQIFFEKCMDEKSCKDIKSGEIDEEVGDCCFVNTDINLTYRVLQDASSQSRKLCALSLCSSFFGAIAIYFFLLVLHHYNNELFFDSGQRIFKGFSGFGGGYKKKNKDKDPAYKKRKLKAEIELTSKNEDNSNYIEVNKNEDGNE